MYPVLGAGRLQEHGSIEKIDFFDPYARNFQRFLEKTVQQDAMGQDLKSGNCLPDYPLFFVLPDNNIDLTHGHTLLNQKTKLSLAEQIVEMEYSLEFTTMTHHGQDCNFP